MEKFKSLSVVAWGCLLLCLASPAVGAGSISYNRDIRPILSDDCFHCHGPDQKTRKGKFRLDVREDAVAKGAIVPGKPGESGIIQRLLTKDPEELMPPPEAHKTVTSAQRDMLRRWIAAGAKYEKHWAYVPPVKPVLSSDRGAVDALIRRRLNEVGLRPALPADRRTLARRLYFDLIGLPPGAGDVEAFVQDKSPAAFAGLVEKLLASPQFGERMAIGWLDVVRFADTIGYHSDNPRNVWPYRDYVIKSFNQNKRFDQFTREQLAGDLLPGSTAEQRVASCFNRLLLTTEEGGAQSKDYEARMLTDRVRAVSAVWLGQTVGCAQCHDHKFDPIKQRDFYALGAFFADIEEPIIGRRESGLLVPDEKQVAELARLQAEVRSLETGFNSPHPECEEAFIKWNREQSQIALEDSRWTSLTPARAVAAGGDKLQIQSDQSVLVAGKKKPETDVYTLDLTNFPSAIQALRIEALPSESLPGKGPGRAGNGNFVLSRVLASIEHTNGASDPLQFVSARASFEQSMAADQTPNKLWSAASVIDPQAKGEFTGWAVLPEVAKPQQIILDCGRLLALNRGDTLKVVLEQNHGHGNHTLGHFRLSATTNTEALRGPFVFPLAKEIDDVLAVPSGKRDQAQRDRVWEYFKKHSPEFATLRTNLAGARKTLTAYEDSLPHCLVSVTNAQPRTVRVLPRGNFLADTGDIMQPALPAYLAGPETKSGGRRLTRLDLADWLVSRENPLTARVVVNRLWKQFFGCGLSKVVDDLGAQGELPPNQPLLDWLACEFMDSGWDLKHMVRLMVNSQAYQQTSVSPKKLRDRDPLNREIAAQSRWRLDAELVRDNALAVSGLLVEKIGGPSTKPYQPEGYWENLNFPARSYEASTGPDQYRRGLYAWWQRSYLHPSLQAFDAPTREECAAERNRSNIPQQALVLLNDPTYVEASRALAVRMLKEGGADPSTRLAWAWRQVLNRTPRPDEIKSVQALLDKELAEYRADKTAAQALLKTGQNTTPPESDPVELAAWTNVARVLLNLHETITRS